MAPRLTTVVFNESENESESDCRTVAREHFHEHDVADAGFERNNHRFITVVFTAVAPSRQRMVLPGDIRTRLAI